MAVSIISFIKLVEKHKGRVENTGKHCKVHKREVMKMGQP